eukprot:9427540-Pyramimonas_sp.AAC.1
MISVSVLRNYPEDRLSHRHLEPLDLPPSEIDEETKSTILDKRVALLYPLVVSACGVRLSSYTL